VSADRSQVPRSTPLPRLSFPGYERRRLSSGLEWILVPRTGVPLVEALLLLPAGGDRDPRARPGLASLTAALVDEGTRRRSGPELALDVERLGARLSTAAGWDAAQIEIELLAPDLERGLRTVAEVAREPIFPEAELERLRHQVLTEIGRRRDQPPLLAEEALATTLYEGDAYDHLLQGTAESLAALSREEVARFHTEGFLPRGAHLLLGGDIAAEEAEALVESIFGDWSPDVLPTPPPTILAPESVRRVVVVDLPEAAQTELRIGHAGVPRTHPDRSRLGVLNALLGGKFTSRLNLNLRERHGYTYGVSSRFVDRRGPGPFVVAAAVGTEVAGAAVRETLAELERLRDSPVSDAELDETRSYLLGVFPYTLQTIDGLLARLADLALHGLEDGYLERSLDEIRDTSAAEILRLARAHLDPERAAIVAVGPAATLAPQLEAFGSVEIVRPA